MPYYFSDPGREQDSHALPNVEVFESKAVYCDCGDLHLADRITGIFPLGWTAKCCGNDLEAVPEFADGFYYAFGFPGSLGILAPFGRILWDGEVTGPFDSEAEALKAARE